MSLIEAPIVAAAGAVQMQAICEVSLYPQLQHGRNCGRLVLFGDNIAANLNNREMVMNMSQHKKAYGIL